MEERKTLVTMNEWISNFATILVIPFCVFFLCCFAYLNGGFSAMIDGKDNIWTIITVFLTLPSIMLHELLHAAGWIIIGKKASDFNFGLKLPFTAYIQFEGTMKTEQFMFGLILPMVVTGLVPMSIGLITGNFYVLIYGVIMTPGCGSDMLSFIRCFKHLGKEIADTKGQTGFMVLER